MKCMGAQFVAFAMRLHKSVHSVMSKCLAPFCMLLLLLRLIGILLFWCYKRIHICLILWHTQYRIDQLCNAFSITQIIAIKWKKIKETQKYIRVSIVVREHESIPSILLCNIFCAICLLLLEWKEMRKYRIDYTQLPQNGSITLIAHNTKWLMIWLVLWRMQLIGNNVVNLSVGYDRKTCFCLLTNSGWTMDMQAPSGLIRSRTSNVRSDDLQTHDNTKVLVFKSINMFIHKCLIEYKFL